MKTKSIPALIMLTAGLVACIAGITVRMEMFKFLKMLILVLLLFYILGGIVKFILDKNFPDVQEEKTADGNENENENESENEEENSGETEQETQKLD